MPVFSYTCICSVTMARWRPEPVVHLVHRHLQNEARSRLVIFRGTAYQAQTRPTKAVCIALFSFCGLCCVESSSTPHSAQVLENGSDQQSMGCSAAHRVLVAPALRNFTPHFGSLLEKSH